MYGDSFPFKKNKWTILSFIFNRNWWLLNLLNYMAVNLKQKVPHKITPDGQFYLPGEHHQTRGCHKGGQNWTGVHLEEWITYRNLHTTAPTPSWSKTLIPKLPELYCINNDRVGNGTHYMKNPERFSGKKVVVGACGGNIGIHIIWTLLWCLQFRS